MMCPRNRPARPVSPHRKRNQDLEVLPGPRVAVFLAMEPEEALVSPRHASWSKVCVLCCDVLLVDWVCLTFDLCLRCSLAAQHQRQRQAQRRRAPLLVVPGAAAQVASHAGACVRWLWEEVLSICVCVCVLVLIISSHVCDCCPVVALFSFFFFLSVSLSGHARDDHGHERGAPAGHVRWQESRSCGVCACVVVLCFCVTGN